MVMVVALWHSLFLLSTWPVILLSDPLSVPMHLLILYPAFQAEEAVKPSQMPYTHPPTGSAIFFVKLLASAVFCTWLPQTRGGAPETLMEVETHQAGGASPAGRQRNK